MIARVKNKYGESDFWLTTALIVLPTVTVKENHTTPRKAPCHPQNGENKPLRCKCPMMTAIRMTGRAHG